MTFHNRKIWLWYYFFLSQPIFTRSLSAVLFHFSWELKVFLLSSSSTQAPAWPHSVIPFHRIAHCFLLWFVVFLHMWDKAKSNWRNKSELSERWRGSPELKVGLFQMSQLLYSLHPSVKRVRMELSRGKCRAGLSIPVSQAAGMMRRWEVVYHAITRAAPLLLSPRLCCLPLFSVLPQPVM